MDVYWLEQTQADVPADNDWLSASEAIRLNSLIVPKRRADWRLGRWTAKHALAAYLKIPDAPECLVRIEIHASDSGAPEGFVGDGRVPACISLTHRDDLAVCAVAPSGTMLGCDLEKIEPRSDLFMSDYFAPEEQERLAEASSKDRSRLAALLWSAKESALKALRTGLRLDTRSVVASLDLAVPATQNGWRPLHVCCNQKEIFGGWWLQSGDMVITLVAAPPPGPPIRLAHASSHNA